MPTLITNHDTHEQLFVHIKKIVIINFDLISSSRAENKIPLSAKWDEMWIKCDAEGHENCQREREKIVIIASSHIDAIVSIHIVCRNSHFLWNLHFEILKWKFFLEKHETMPSLIYIIIFVSLYHNFHGRCLQLYSVALVLRVEKK